MQHTRVVVVDEHPAMRQGLVSLLRTMPDIEVVTGVASPEAAIAAVATLSPAVVVLDVLMQPPGTGLALVRRFARSPVGAKVLAVAAEEHPDLAQTAARAGAATFLPKSVDLETLIATVRSLAGGGVTSVVQPDSCAPATQPNPTAAEDVGSARARLLRHLAAGLSNRAIAHHEGVSERTIKRRITQLYLRLGASHRAGAVATAMQLGLI
jgi:DNA-binding NarL/FixJ family response regulator